MPPRYLTHCSHKKNPCSRRAERSCPPTCSTLPWCPNELKNAVTLAARIWRFALTAAITCAQSGAYAADWMAQRGFRHPIIIGHSNGGMLAVKHVSDHPETPAMVLLSAHGGGRDGVQRTSRAGMLADDRLEEITTHARALVSAGRGRKLMLVPGWWYVISAESFLDRMTEMPDVLELAPTIRCPTLFIRGDEENPDNYPAERFKERSGGPCDVEIVENCNHFYVGREAAVWELVSGWLAKRLDVALTA